MRKVTVEARIEVPVTVKVRLHIKANDGADMALVMKRLATGHHIVDGASLDDMEVLSFAPIEEQVPKKGFKVLDYKVTDSR